MFKKWLKYSYADQKTQSARISAIVLRTVLLFIVYIAFTNFVFYMRSVENTSMQPALNPGDHLIFSSFSVRSYIKDSYSLSKLPVERGNIVLIDRNADQENSGVSFVFDRIVRFFTLGKIGYKGYNNNLFVKRIIGLPGDTVSLTNFVLRVRPAGSPYTFTEFELSDELYYPNIPQVSSLWDSSLPFSGNLDPIVLGENQCFVLSDDRGNTNDSRTWGAVTSTHIRGKAIFRYWPPNHLGFP
ncbi:signal peptidase I [Spirochaetia bacterium]|nr:signal peptidase I [Spirochaetia bacterium]